jgi:hypothetical protein
MNTFQPYIYAAQAPDAGNYIVGADGSEAELTLPL